MESTSSESFVDDFVGSTLDQVLQDMIKEKDLCDCNENCLDTIDVRKKKMLQPANTVGRISNTKNLQDGENEKTPGSVPSLREIAFNAKQKLLETKRHALAKFAPIIRLTTSDSEISLDESSCSIEVLCSDNEDHVLPDVSHNSATDNGEDLTETNGTDYDKGYEEGYEAGRRQYLWLLNRTVEERDDLFDLFKENEVRWIEENELLLVEVQEIRHAYNELISQFSKENPCLPNHAYQTLFSNTFSNDRALATCVNLQHKINEQTLKLYSSYKEKVHLQRQVSELEQILTSVQIDNGRGDSLWRHPGDGQEISRTTLSDVTVMDDHSREDNGVKFISDPQLSIISNFNIGNVSVNKSNSSSSSAENSP